MLKTNTEPTTPNKPGFRTRALALAAGALLLAGCAPKVDADTTAVAAQIPAAATAPSAPTQAQTSAEVNASTPVVVTQETHITLADAEQAFADNAKARLLAFTAKAPAGAVQVVRDDVDPKNQTIKLTTPLSGSLTPGHSDSDDPVLVVGINGTIDATGKSVDPPDSMTATLTNSNMGHEANLYTMIYTKPEKGSAKTTVSYQALDSGGHAVTHNMSTEPQTGYELITADNFPAITQQFNAVMDNAESGTAAWPAAL